MTTSTLDTQKTHQIRRGVLIAMAAGALLALIPILIFAAWTVRAVALIALPVAALGVLLSPGLRRWFGFTDDVDAHYKGVRLPADRMVHPTHVWLQPQGIGRVSLGVDDLAQRALGPVEVVKAPEVGAEITRGEPLFEVRRGDRTLDVVAPVTGRVEAVNARLAERPGLVNDDPYGLGWVVELKVARRDRRAAAVRHADTAREWLASEVDRLIGLMNPVGAHATAMDGGVVSEHLHADIDDDTWARVNHDLFGAP